MKNLFKEISESIKKAEVEAIKQGIKVNTVMLNKNHAICHNFYSALRINTSYTNVTEIPPMILGKALVLVDFLPDDFDFALTFTNVNSPSDIIEKLKEENKLLKKYIRVVGSGGKEQFIFKNISSKRNKKDFERIKEALDDGN